MIGEPALNIKWVYPAPEVTATYDRGNHRHDPGTLKYRWKGQYIPVTDLVRMEPAGMDTKPSIAIYHGRPLPGGQLTHTQASLEIAT
jgi:hypothetical protein